LAVALLHAEVVPEALFYDTSVHTEYNKITSPGAARILLEVSTTVGIKLNESKALPL